MIQKKKKYEIVCYNFADTCLFRQWKIWHKTMQRIKCLIRTTTTTIIIRYYDIFIIIIVIIIIQKYTTGFKWN